MAMYLLWEDATPPDGWTIDTNHEDLILKAGDEYVQSGGGHTHTVTTAWVTAGHVADRKLEIVDGVILK